MKTINIQTREGQYSLLADMILLDNECGYEEGEENKKNYNEGYMQALSDILGITKLTFTLNGKYYTNERKK